MINEIQPKIKFQNIVQCPFKYGHAIYVISHPRQESEYKIQVGTWFYELHWTVFHIANL